MKIKGAKWISRELIRSPYYIGLCISEKHFKNELKRLKIPRKSQPDWITNKKDGTTHFLENTTPRHSCAIVCIDYDPKIKKAAVYGLLVHEAVHIWREILWDMGKEKPSPEFECYSIQAISTRLIDAYDFLVKKMNKK